MVKFLVLVEFVITFNIVVITLSQPDELEIIL